MSPSSAAKRRQLTMGAVAVVILCVMYYPGAFSALTWMLGRVLGFLLFAAGSWAVMEALTSLQSLLETRGYGGLERDYFLALEARRRADDRVPVSLPEWERSKERCAEYLCRQFQLQRVVSAEFGAVVAAILQRGGGLTQLPPHASRSRAGRAGRARLCGVLVPRSAPTRRRGNRAGMG